MSDETNGTNGTPDATPTPEAKPLDYWLCESAGDGVLSRVSVHTTSGEAAKAAKRLLGTPEAEGRTYFVMNRVYGPIALRERAVRVSVKVDGLGAKRSRPRKPAAEKPAKASAPRKRRTAETAEVASV